MGPEATGSLLLQGSLFLLHKKKIWSNKRSSILFYSADPFRLEWHFKNASFISQPFAGHCVGHGSSELNANDFALKELTV